MIYKVIQINIATYTKTHSAKIVISREMQYLSLYIYWKVTNRPQDVIIRNTPEQFIPWQYQQSNLYYMIANFKKYYLLKSSLLFIFTANKCPCDKRISLQTAAKRHSDLWVHVGSQHIIYRIIVLEDFVEIRKNKQKCALKRSFHVEYGHL